jgi:tRNA A-37 threonylcarbamoyl transferase component Bud32
MMCDDSFEPRVRRFEQAWLSHGPCEIDDHLGERSGLTDPDRFRLLIELICIDLEFRWRNARVAQPVALGDYVGRFPELISLDRLPLELIAEEYRVRCLWGDRPSHAAILSQFHERYEPIREELFRVDDELKAESTEPLHLQRTVPRSSPREEDPGLDRDQPLLSHHDFLLRRLIGAGLMGKVYEARHHSASREVAVKFLRKSFLNQPEVVRRFIGEASTIARLRHPNIVGTQGLGRAPGGAYFIVMDLVVGSNLALLGIQREIAVDEAIRWAIETCEALEHAHGRGVVHCDLKPANLLLDERGRIRVTDFGLARSLTGDTPCTAEVEGTVPFMAPEQASRCWGPIDQRTDVYGIGAILFTLLTGRPPFLGRRLPDILAAVVSGTPVISPASLRPDLPESISDLCRKCLNKAPEARFPSIQEVRWALARIQQDGSRNGQSHAVHSAGRR